MEDLKKHGHTYFAHKNQMLFGTVKSSLSLSATNFPVFPEGKTLLEAAKEGDEGMKNVQDPFAIALTVQSRIPGQPVTGGTMILTEAEQDNFILGILERRGKKGIGNLIVRMGLELPDEGIAAGSDVKSKICPPENTKLPGESTKDLNAKEKLVLLMSLLDQI